MFLKFKEGIYNIDFIKSFHIEEIKMGTFLLILTDSKGEKYTIDTFSTLDRAEIWLKYIHSILNLEPKKSIIEKEYVES